MRDEWIWRGSTREANTEVSHKLRDLNMSPHELSLGSTTRTRPVPLCVGLLIMPGVRAWRCARPCTELAIRGAQPRPRQ
jgi:hypothetical protein